MKIIKLIIIICFLKLKNTVTLFTYVRKRDIIGKKRDNDEWETGYSHML